MPDEPPSLSTEGKKDISESQRRSAFRAKKSRNKVKSSIYWHFEVKAAFNKEE